MVVLEAGTRRAIKRLAERGGLRSSLPTPAERRQVRRRAGVSAEEFAGALGVSRTVLYDWEAGRRSPSPGFRERYVEALRILGESADRWGAS